MTPQNKMERYQGEQPLENILSQMEENLASLRLLAEAINAGEDVYVPYLQNGTYTDNVCEGATTCPCCQGKTITEWKKHFRTAGHRKWLEGINSQLSASTYDPDEPPKFYSSRDVILHMGLEILRLRRAMQST